MSDDMPQVEAFIGGHVTAQGQFQEVFGTVRRRFYVDIRDVQIIFDRHR